MTRLLVVLGMLMAGVGWAQQGPVVPLYDVLGKETPPMFLACGAEDEPRIAEAVPELYLQMRRAGAPVELHVLAGVGHGFGLRERNGASVRAWPEMVRWWLEGLGMVQR